jgi:hypothetical protein
MNAENRQSENQKPQSLLNALCAKKWIFMITIFVVLARPTFSAAGEGPPPGRPEAAEASVSKETSAGIEELANILVEKGLLKREELAVLSQQKGVSSLSALTELLRRKGLLTMDEAEKVSMKGKTGGAGSITLYQERGPGEMEKLTQNVALELKKDFKDEVKAEIKEEMLQETQKNIQAAAAPEWTKRVRFGGDIRLRYQGDYFGKNNAVVIVDPNNLSRTLNTEEDRHRVRVRARLSATADINEVTEAGLRVTTGNETNPSTANQTMGTYENKYSIVLDQAYLKIKPLRGLTFQGGRILNPFFQSGLIWDEELTFDAIMGGYTTPLTEKIGTFLTAGIFPLEEFEYTSKDKWLFAAQAGGDFKPVKGLTGRLGVGYYNYKNLKGSEIDPLYPNSWQQYSAYPFTQKGNTIININPAAVNYTEYKMALGSDFEELHIAGLLDIGFWEPIHVVLSGEYVKNVGFNYKPADGSSFQKYNYGYQAGLSVGVPEIKKAGDWKVYGYYRYLGADAVVDAFTDPAFHLGGTNAKGWALSVQVGLAKNLWLSGKWVTTNEITGPPMAIDSLFFDVNARF